MLSVKHVNRKSLGLAVTLFVWCGTASAQGLPGGASSLNETHGDWTVTCATAKGVVQCAMVQNQVSGEKRQRTLSAQLTIAKGGAAANGVLVLPFGLRLDAGVRLAIDEKAAMPARRFSTCLPAGCIVPLSFDAGTLKALNAGKALRVMATADDSRQEVALSVSLSGFASALNRVAQLNGS